MTFEPNPLDIDVYDLFNRQPASSTELARAMEFLTDSLTDGEVLSTEIDYEWIENEGGSKSTLKRAKRELGIKAQKRMKDGVAASWLSLPDQGDQGDQDQALATIDPLDEQ